jgi:hypothetical protein
MAQGTDGKTCDNRPRQSDREAPKTCQILLRTHFAPTTIPTTYHSPNLSNEQIRYINSSILQGGTVAVNTFDDNTQITKPQAPAKDANGKDDKDANKEPKERPLDLTHDEIMIDLFFVLTILKSCIDIDKRLSSYLTRIVSPNLSGNLHLRSLAQPRLDSIRSSLESKQQQYLQSYAVYISYCFDSILKLVPVDITRLKVLIMLAVPRRPLPCGSKQQNCSNLPPVPSSHRSQASMSMISFILCKTDYGSDYLQN